MNPQASSIVHLRALRAQWPYLPRALKLVWTAARGWTIAWAALLVMQGALPVATVYLTKTLVDSLVEALTASPTWETVRPTLLLVGLMAVVLLLSELMRSQTTWVRTAQAELVQDHISDLIQRQAAALDLAFYESPDYYDQLHRARVDARMRPLALLENVGGLVQNSITLVAMIGVLLPYGLGPPLLLLLGTLPALWVAIRYTLRFHRWRLRNTKAVRRTRYYEWLLTRRESAAELRLFDLGDHFREAFQRVRLGLRTERIALARDQALAELIAGGLGLLALAAGMAWMIWRAVQGAVTLGDVALFYQAFSQGQRMMRTLLNNIGEVVRNVLFLENLFEFLALRPQISSPTSLPSLQPQPPFEVRLQNVRFCYPDSARPALDGLDLVLPPGQIVALVGKNGAGKSTIAKLICRFYDPSVGRVLLNGRDIRDLPLDWLRRQITVLFQESVHYHTTAARNIALGDLAAEPTQTAIEAAARAAGADESIRRLPREYETVLGKWFGGAELSGGEWQRLALARAFLRRASIIILDEPTSAMDSWAEADWLARFRRLVAGRTALIITHRFTTAMVADIIHVMDQGRIIESGTHQTLLKFNGRYAESWRNQRSDGQRKNQSRPETKTVNSEP
ncbi:MAG: ABC transporter ATP-binding protein [Chloroflexi bacterium]|nr:ABC transporter ATP-binding protein [Chloroflexota bacterium]